jgi:quinol---cytochrome-c reductase cytochrome b subunit
MSSEDPVRFVDERLLEASTLKKVLRYVFPDHWSFMLGELALYSFVFLVLSGTYLAFFYTPDSALTTWQGPYEPLNGQRMTAAYASVLDIVFKTPGGNLVRQAHHWAANLFLFSIVVHACRAFFTGAFRKPREPIWMIGVLLVGLAMPEGYLGYSMIDDLLSGMGVAIGYAVGLSLPLIGGPLTVLFFGGPLPGADVLFSRFFILHVFVIPVLIAVLIGLHLALIVRAHHTQFPGPGRKEGNTVGSPLWPAYALRSMGLFAATCAILLLGGGLIQINPVWEWGPYHPYLSFNGAQPDWYVGWLIGALRIMPGFDVQVPGGDHTLVPNPFWGGALFPMLVLGGLLAYPWLEQRLRRDGAMHHLLDRPRDSPRRTALGAAALANLVTVELGGITDRVFLALSIDYVAQIWILRVAFFVVPVIAYLVTVRICRELKRREIHPLRGAPGTVVQRTPEGGFRVIDAAPFEENGSSEARVPEAKRRTLR